MYPKSTFANLRAKMFSMMYSFDTMELMVDFGLNGAPFDTYQTHQINIFLGADHLL